MKTGHKAEKVKRRYSKKCGSFKELRGHDGLKKKSLRLISALYVLYLMPTCNQF